MPPESSGGVFLFVEGRIHIVDVFLVHLLTGQLQALAEALEMHHFPGPQELDDVVDVRIVAEPQDVIVGGAGLLFCCDDGRKSEAPENRHRHGAAALVPSSLKRRWNRRCGKNWSSCWPPPFRR